MLKSTAAAAVSVIVLLTSINIAAAQQKQKKKPTYDEAWKICQAEVNKIPSDQHSSNGARLGLHEKPRSQDLKKVTNAVSTRQRSR